MISTTGSISFWSLNLSLSAINGNVFDFIEMFFIVLPKYEGPSGQTETLISSVKESFNFSIEGLVNFKSLMIANSLATPRTLKQSPLFGVMSSLITASLPVTFELITS